MSSIGPETLVRFQAGDIEAFRMIIEHYQEKIFRLGLRLFGQTDEAADFAQDTFLRIFEQRGRYDPKRPFENWFFRVAINLGRDQLRRRREIPTGNEPLELAIEPQAEPEMLKRERNLRVQQALQKVKPKYREGLALRFELDLNLQEMAQIQGISLGTVKSRMSRGLKAFHKAYQALGGE